MGTYNKQWGEYIPSNGINGVLKDWHSKQPPRQQDCASPSTLLDCPRVVWLKKHKVPITNDKGWGFKQRLLLGRIAENQIAAQLQFAGRLLWHWKDFDNGMKPEVPTYKSSEYTAWVNMKMRCYNLNDKSYPEYGGRGITVCEEWKHSFDNFAKDMGGKPDPSYSLDRIDADKGYEPNNCRWASPTTQARNQRAGKNNTSGVRGVYYNKASGAWRAHIKIGGIDTHLGSFTEKQDAIDARLVAEQELWKDDVAGESVKFTHGEGLQRMAGTGDILMTLDDGRVAISDSKTSRADSFKYVPTLPSQIFKDHLWYKYKIQVTAYYLLSHWNKDWFEANKLPLPEVCHLFSYALDDGIVRREITWTPTREDAEEILALTKRWNMAYASETMPDCLCREPADDQGIKFCDFAHAFATTKTGYKLGIECCADSLGDKANV